MSFTVKYGTTTVYSLPDSSGNSGDVLTVGSSTTSVSWSPIPSKAYYGEIVMWYPTGNNDHLSSNTSNGGYSPSIDNTLQSDWYLCDGSDIKTTSGSNITLPDMSGYVPVGADSTQTCSSGGNRQIIESIPIASHTHQYSYNAGQGSKDTNVAGSHTHGNNIRVNTFHTQESQLKGGEDKTVYKDIQHFQISFGVQDGGQHSHGIQLSCSHDEERLTGTKGSDSTFKHCQIYFIIYLT